MDIVFQFVQFLAKASVDPLVCHAHLHSAKDVLIHGLDQFDLRAEWSEYL
jgi:hypothetical protein